MKENIDWEILVNEISKVVVPLQKEINDLKLQLEELKHEVSEMQVMGGF